MSVYSNVPNVLSVNIALCIIVSGGWSSWTYGSCSKTCGGGTQTLTRRCSNPKPSCGGRGCSGSSNRQTICNTHCCAGKITYVHNIIYIDY